jgi:hypothetical protein
MKLYYDASVAVGGATVTWGAHLMTAADDLVDCFDRFIPSTPAPPKPTQPPGQAPEPIIAPLPEPLSQPLPWWDNSRYMLHGRFRLAADDLALRFLLPRPRAAAPPPSSSPFAASRRRAGSIAMGTPPPPELVGLAPPLPAVVFHLSRAEFLSTVADPDKAKLFQARPVAYPRAEDDGGDDDDDDDDGGGGGDDDEARKPAPGAWIDARRDVRLLSVETLTVSVPSVGPGDWHSSGGRAAHRQYLLALVPKLQLTIALDWQQGTG